MNKKISILFLLFIFSLSFVLVGQERKKIQDAFDFSASYTGDCMFNIDGGIKTGSNYLGMMSIGIGFDVQKAGLWNGGNFFINAVNLHGSSPTENYIGDSQVASNIDAGEHSYIQEFWYSQKIKDLEFIVGLQDINVSFANSNVGALYLNSSFGILPTIANNFHAPIFPLTAPSFIVKWHINNNFSWNNAITGEHTDFDDNKYNLKWDFNRQTGLTFLS